ncbi:MAG: hypothetical protein EOM58_07930, partial [Clostridia bacterium]|nr:hypothetical protein [Clostridia bacterium]
MKPIKRLLLLTLCAALALSMNIQALASGAAYDKVTYAYATFNNIPSEEALSEVEEAINVITREKINAEV